MDTDYIINYLKDNTITPYKVSKETGVSINTINDLIDGKRTPRSNTLRKLTEYIEKEEAVLHQELAKIKEPSTEYKNVTNTEIFNLLEYIGSALIKNNEATTDLLIRTHQNTVDSLKILKEINVERLNKLTLKAKSL